ncbi:Uncharacterised protein [uncultured archaeon]|nr:Uncharacterised protein [uncultured archaeon]
MAGSECAAPFARAVQFCDNDSSQSNCRMKLLRLSAGRLSDISRHHQYFLLRFHFFHNSFELFHKLLVKTRASCRVYDNYVLFYEGQMLLQNFSYVFFSLYSMEWRAAFCPQLLQLLICCRPVCVCANQGGPQPSFFVELRNFATCCGFAASVKTEEQNASRLEVGLILLSQKCHKLVVNRAHHLLAQGNALCLLFPKHALFYSFREFENKLDRHIICNKHALHIAQKFLHSGLVHKLCARELGHCSAQSLAQVHAQSTCILLASVSTILALRADIVFFIVHTPYYSYRL